MSTTEIKVEIPKGWTVEIAHGVIIYGLHHEDLDRPEFIRVADISPGMQEIHETATLVTIAPTITTRIRKWGVKTKGTVIKWDDYTEGPAASVEPIEDQLNLLILEAINQL